MSKLVMVVTLEYDADIMHGDDKESKEWFFDQITGGDTHLFVGGDLGDMVGKIDVKMLEEIKGYG